MSSPPLQPFACDKASAVLAQCDITLKVNSCTLNDKTPCICNFMSFNFLDVQLNMQLNIKMHILTNDADALLNGANPN